MKDLIRRIYEKTEPIRVVSLWICIALSMVYIVIAVVVFPIVMAVNISWMWLLGYIAYFFLMYLLYELLDL